MLHDCHALAIAGVSDETIRAFFTALAPTVAAITAYLAAKKGVAQNHELKAQGKIIQDQTNGQLSHLTELLDAEHKKNEELRKLITALVDKDIEVRRAKAVVDSQSSVESLGRLMKTEEPPQSQPKQEDRPSL